MAQLTIKASNAHSRSILSALGAAITLSAESQGSWFIVESDKLIITGPQIIIRRRTLSLMMGTQMSDASWNALVETGVQSGNVCERSDQHFVVR
jgi:hypothetical protein